MEVLRLFEVDVALEAKGGRERTKHAVRECAGLVGFASTDQMAILIITHNLSSARSLVFYKGRTQAQPLLRLPLDPTEGWPISCFNLASRTVRLARGTTRCRSCRTRRTLSATMPRGCARSCVARSGSQWLEWLEVHLVQRGDTFDK